MKRIVVKVKPGAKVESVREENGEIVATVRAPARVGAANEAPAQRVSLRFKIPQASLRLVHGARSRSKTLELP